MISNGSGHGQASGPHPLRADRLAIHSAAAHFIPSILTSLPLSFVVIEPMSVTDLRTDATTCHKLIVSAAGGAQVDCYSC